MRKLYVKLAAVNICNNRQLYLPYLLAGVFSAAMFYLVMSIQDNPGLEQMRGGNAAARSDHCRTVRGDFPVLYQQLHHEAAQTGIERIQYTWDGEETYRQGAFPGNAVYGGGYDRRRTVVRHCIRQADDDAFIPHDRI